MMTDAIQVSKVNKKYKNFQIKNVDFTIKEGFITEFIGPNGAGKTTIIKMIMNLVRKESGDIKVFNQNFEAHEKR